MTVTCRGKYVLERNVDTKKKRKQRMLHYKFIAIVRQKLNSKYNENKKLIKLQLLVVFT